MGHPHPLLVPATRRDDMVGSPLDGRTAGFAVSGMIHDWSIGFYFQLISSFWTIASRVQYSFLKAFLPYEMWETKVPLEFACCFGYVLQLNSYA